MSFVWNADLAVHLTIVVELQRSNRYIRPYLSKYILIIEEEACIYMMLQMVLTEKSGDLTCSEKLHYLFCSKNQAEKTIIKMLFNSFYFL